eukprot:Phypoly_transcript_13723.p1 GENE.Phypoly_transcript_13723~~Phypoly_transcript_13723.p1  ORF type:complete len:336 (-),score=42.68 Phypoly_transcript_13723:35-1015(-)
MEVIVIGCGIIGLSTAISLQQNGRYKVTIVAKDLPPNTTSNKAAAVWFPYLAYPLDKIGRWASHTMEHLKKDVQEPNSGVIVQKTVELFREEPSEPEWKEYVPTLQRAAKEDLPETFTHGFSIIGIVADTDLYLDFLMDKFVRRGGTIIQKEVNNIDELFTKYNIVINCSGLGARELVNDDTIYPTRGQTVIVKNKEHSHSLMYDGYKPEDLVYIVPRTRTTVLGGTAQANNWNLQPDENDTKDILKKVGQLHPSFRDVEVVKVKVGLRPTRPSVRLEHEWRQDGEKLLVHNYGHGGSGYTIGWGCAMDVVDIVNANIKPTWHSRL